MIRREPLGERHNDSYLRRLEAEAIHILREVAGQFDRPVILFSGGKDSATLVHLMRKAFAPMEPPVPLLHVDTGHNFSEVLEFRDFVGAHYGVEIITRRVQDAIDQGRVKEETGPFASRNALQTVTLLDAIREHRFDAAVGGARRDEEKARAKERIFSHRDSFGQWDPKNQRPELWNLYNGRKQATEHFRVFPLSNWTELDVWNYIAIEQIPLPSIYFAHRRRVIRRGNQLVAETPFTPALNGELLEEKLVRFRTVGDATCTGAMESRASTIDEVIAETAALRTSERGSRLDDQKGDSAMEDRKRLGYF